MSRFDWSDLPIGGLVSIFLLIAVLVTFIGAFAIGGGTGGGAAESEVVRPAESPAEKLARLQGCLACHSNTSTDDIVGPSWVLLYGSTVTMTDGTTVTVDDAYLEESIVDATAKVVEGFGPVSVMPSFEGTLTDQEITTLINYIRSLEAGPQATPTPEGEATPEGETAAGE
jgi:mono/diheme cytochrome c family protein